MTKTPDRKASAGRLALFLLLIVFQVADVATTKAALAVPGNREMNPAMLWCIDNLGALGWFAPKLALIGFAAVILRKSSRRWPLTVAVSIYTTIVANNLIAMLAPPMAGV